jgi:tripartite-type tricarboxylate transporter receptor subunit TctC
MKKLLIRVALALLAALSVDVQLHAAIVDQGSAPALNDVAQDADFRKRHDDIGAFTAGSSPAEFARFIEGETLKRTAVVKRAGFPPN